MIGTKRDRSRPENRTVLTCPPRPWARTTITKVTSPMGGNDQHHGHLALGRNDQHHGHLAHGRGRSAPGSPRPGARTIQSRPVRLVSTLVSSI
ncbi:hypothetical protein F2Q68_00038801 [Brassica cretica]|uniref:Uncharacterized protein n=1 Tax=Brassica cretica TaxID=69181 RepID=A0A8S9MFG2_BRACR|nr:hypothetical protein F2Q68_00038801 [Brassica cretica]